MSTQLGFGRLLVAVYWVFAVSASARAIYQLITEFSQAPAAYSLSAIAAVVYVVATIALSMGIRGRRLALLALGFELAGVLIVGVMSFALPELFAHPSVWSGFGSGYGYVPLILPIVGLIWLWRHRAANS